MRYYCLHDLIYCVTAKESLWLKEHEIAPFPDARANVLILPMESSPSEAVTFDHNGFPSKARRVSEWRWECYGANHNMYLVFQELLLLQGASFVHGSAIEWKGRGILVWGRGGVGKTVVALSALKEPGMLVLADDVAIVHSDGTVLSFHKPLALYPYHWLLLRESLPGRYLFMMKLVAFIAKAKQLWWIGRKVKRWVASSDRASQSWVGRLNPGYVAVLPSELFGSHRLGESARLSLSVMLRKGKEWCVKQVSAEKVRDAMLSVTYKELEMARSLFDYGAAQLLSVGCHWRIVEGIVSDFIEKGQHYEVEIPEGDPITKMQDKILETIDKLL